jgi:hypothetical protein
VHPDDRAQAGSTGTQRSAPASLLRLQRALGNRAVTQILARAPVAGKRPQADKPAPPGFHGDGRHRATDVAYAGEVGKADAARLDADADPMSARVRADITAKLRWFQGGAYDAYVAQVKPALARATKPPIEMPEEKVVQPLSERERNALERNVDDWFGLIQKLQESRLNAWEKNAGIPEAKPSIDVLEIVIAIVAEGLGGVVYGVIENMLAKRSSHLLTEFVGLAGLEAGDLAAESAFHAALKSVRGDFETAVKTAASEENVQKSVKGALKKGNNALSFYVEAIRNQTIAQEMAGHGAFNKASPQMSDQDLRAKNAALTVVYEELADVKEKYQRELTVGFIRMMDEARLEERAKRWGGNRALTFYYDRDWSVLRAGEIAVEPAGDWSPINPHGRSHGSWANPDLSFEGFNAYAGAINDENLDNLVDTPLQELNLTMQFAFWVKNPYSGWNTGPFVAILFKRDPSGRIIVMDDGDSKEWLTSYYTRESRDHTDKERDEYAPRGAAKLYDAVKTKSVKGTRVMPLYQTGD